jgi:hypothetical protein
MCEPNGNLVNGYFWPQNRANGNINSHFLAVGYICGYKKVSKDVTLAILFLVGKLVTLDTKTVGV